MAFATNRQARRDFILQKEFEAGISLFGFEVKSVRAGRVTLNGARVIVRGAEAFLVGASISPYQVNNTPKDYDPERSRKLLLTKKELDEIARAEQQQGLTVIPISLYNKGRFIKISVAIARGQKKQDKREKIKKRDIQRDLERTLKIK